MSSAHGSMRKTDGKEENNSSTTFSSSSSPLEKQVQAICQVSLERAKELLEASNHSVERAIDIHFHQQHRLPIIGAASGAGAEESGAASSPNSTKKTETHDQGEQIIIKENPKEDERILPQKHAQVKELPSLNSPSKRKQVKRQNFEHLGTPNKNIDTRSPKTKKPRQAKLDSFYSSTPRGKVKTDTRPENNQVIEIADEKNIDDGNDVKKPTAAAHASSSSQEHKFPYTRLADTLQRAADTTKRTIKLEAIKTCIQEIAEFHKKDTAMAASIITSSLQLVLGRPSTTEQAPLEVSGSLVSKCLQTILGVSRKQLSEGYRATGDLGDAAAKLFTSNNSISKTFFSSTKQVDPLSIVTLIQELDRIVETSGRDAKQRRVTQVLRKCQTKNEIRFLVRLLVSNMRVGCNLKTVLAALAMATCASRDDTKATIALVQKTHDICPDLYKITLSLLQGGEGQMVEECTIQLLTPISPMLANPIHSLDRVEKLMSESQERAVLEWKYDGVRCQAHYDGTKLKLFSRHMLDTTEQYPDAAESILDAFRRQMDKNSPASAHSFILDAEIVGVEGNGGNQRLLPFQDLSRRKKTHDGQGARVKVFAFDLMYLNRSSLVNAPLWERKQQLHASFACTRDFDFVTSYTIDQFDEAKIQSYLKESVAGGTEGLMLKLLGTSEEQKQKQNNTISAGPKTCYEAGTRSQSWLKIKRDYVEGYADTIDVVPIGAWRGTGRKAQKKFLSPILLGVYDEKEDVFRSISRCMSFTDKMYEAIREFYLNGTPYPDDLGYADGGSEHQSQDKSLTSAVLQDDEDSNLSDPQVDPSSMEESSVGVHCYASRPSSAHIVTNESPPIWFKPMEVFEVSFADMSLSRQHTAAAGLINDPEGRGVALRFPRFKRRRPDKTIEQATSCAQIAQLFSQQSKQSSRK